MKGNGFISWLLRSPFHGMLSGSTLLITVKGSKSGQEITTPVNFAQDGKTLWITSFRNRRWWRNLRGGQPVRLRLKGKDVQGRGMVVEDKPEVEQALGTYLIQMPQSVRYFGVKLDENGLPDAQDLARAAEGRVMVKVTI